TRTGGTGAAGLGGAPGAGAPGGAGAGGAAGVGATGGTGAGTAVSAGGPAGAGAAGGTGAGGAAGVGADAGGTVVVPAGSGGAARPRLYFLVSPLPTPSPYAGPTGGLAERREPESRPASPVCTARTSRRVPRRSSLVAESESVCPPSVGGECALSTDVLEDRQEEFQYFSAALPHLVSTLLAPEGDPDAPDIPTPRSYAEAVEGPYSSQWQAAMDAEMASWKSTGTYVDEVPPPGANIPGVPAGTILV
ncbi:unnamed protein product, partial [Closterium sp. NIES-54]